MCSALSIGKSMFTVNLIPESRGASQSCGYCFTGAVITQQGPFPLFSLTFGFSPLAVERGHLNTELIDCICCYHMVFKNLGYLPARFMFQSKCSFLKKILSLRFVLGDYSSPLKVSSSALNFFFPN